MKSAGFLITGNEVLSAKTKDTNGPFMGMHLRRIGISVKASMMCSDLEADLIDCLNYLAERCDVILMTGGLGPTSDDLTAEVIAHFFNIPIKFNQIAWDACADFFIKAGRASIPESNKKQALLPDGCELIPNKLGTAAGFCTSGLKFGKMVKIYSMPGVPYEMEPMFLNHVLPDLVDESSMPVSKNWQVFLMGESFMQSAIGDSERILVELFPDSIVSYQAHPYYVSYGVTLFPKSSSQQSECEKYLSNVYQSSVEKAFGGNILYSEDKKVPFYIVDKLKSLKLKIAFAESSCAGYLTKEISIVNLDSSFFAGSIVANTNKIKKDILRLPEYLIASGNKASQELALHMSLAVLREFESDIALSECGTIDNIPPSAKEETDNGFYLAISLKKKSFQNYENIIKILDKFAWKKSEILDISDVYLFSCFIKLNKRHTREVQQTRACHYLLCSLSAIL